MRLLQYNLRKPQPSVLCATLSLLLCSIVFSSNVVCRCAFAAPAYAKTIHVPFHLEPGGLIGFDAEVNGKIVPCIFDTGAATIIWPSHFEVTTFATGPEQEFSDFAGEPMPFHHAGLSSIKIGDFVVRNMWGWELSEDTPELSKRQKLNTLFYTRMLLPSKVFAGTSVTIDYQKQELIINPNPVRDLVDSSEAKRNKNVLVNFNLEQKDGGYYGLPVVHAEIEKVPVRLLVDTGWTNESAFLTASTGRKIKEALSKKQAGENVLTVQADLAAGSGIVTKMEWFPSLQFSIGDEGKIICDRPAHIANGPPPSADGAIGWSILRHFRVTINYVTRQFLLEPVTPLNSLSPPPGTQLIQIGDVKIYVPFGSTIIVAPPLPGGNKPGDGTPGSITVVPPPGTAGNKPGE